MEDMRNAVTSTPAVEPLELEYEETTTEDPYSSDTSGHTNESDDSEASFKGFSHKEYLRQPSTAQRQTDAEQETERQSTQEEVNTSRDNIEYEFSHGDHRRQTAVVQTIENQLTQAEANMSRENSEYEWDELQTVDISGEERALIETWERLLREAIVIRRCVKMAIIKGLRDISKYMEVARQPEEINRENKINK